MALKHFLLWLPISLLVFDALFIPSITK